MRRGRLDEVPWRSKVETQTRGDTSSSFRAWETINVHLHGWGWWEGGFIQLACGEALDELQGIVIRWSWALTEANELVGDWQGAGGLVENLSEVGCEGIEIVNEGVNECTIF